MHRRLFLAVIVALALTGCTASPPQIATPEASATRTPTETTTTPSGAPTGLDALPLSGQLVSQGAPTEGTVTISRTSENEFEITLTGFSTGPGDDLRLNLSPGSLEKKADGYFSVTDNMQYELPGKIDPASTNQTFVFAIPSFPMDTIRSFTVYDYANRTAFGSAALN